MTKEAWMYTALAAAAIAAYIGYKHHKLVTDMKAPDNAAGLAASSAAVRADVG
jgi:hypothetical protein